jgi:membrane protein
MLSATALSKRVYRMGIRVFPECLTISQAVAFNLFLAFFPTLLVAVGVANTRIGGKTSLLDLITDLTRFLPPGSQQVVAQFLVKRGPDAWKLALVGWVGTLLAGTQVMKLLMEGIHMVYGEPMNAGFIRRQLRALLLLLVTMAPLVAAAILGVFGRPLRRWYGREFGHSVALQGVWGVFFPAAAIVLAAASLTVIYRVARPYDEKLRNVLPGAMVATLLWWLANVLFGFYVRQVPYSVVYGGLAAVIGLMIWMQVSTVIVFLGAAWNAELAESRKNMAVQIARKASESPLILDSQPLDSQRLGPQR